MDTCIIIGPWIELNQCAPAAHASTDVAEPSSSGTLSVGGRFHSYHPHIPPPPPPIPTTTTTTTTTATTATTTPPPINSRVHGQGNWRDPARQLGVRLGPGQQYTTMTPHRESGSKVSDASQLPAPSLTCERQPVSTENAGHLTCSCLFPSCASVGLVGAVFKETGPIHTLSV